MGATLQLLQLCQYHSQLVYLKVADAAHFPGISLLLEMKVVSVESVADYYYYLNTVVEVLEISWEGNSYNLCWGDFHSAYSFSWAAEI